MVNLDLAVGSLGIALSMILWGIDKLGGDGHPTFKKGVGLVYLVVGVFWLYVAYVAATTA